MGTRKTKIVEFETTDLPFAAALLCLGKKMQRLDRQQHSEQGIFIFDDDGTLDDNYSEFINGEMRVDPNQLMHQIRNLKSSLRGDEGRFR